jgi:hypothetical protein
MEGNFERVFIPFPSAARILSFIFSFIFLIQKFLHSQQSVNFPLEYFLYNNQQSLLVVVVVALSLWVRKNHPEQTRAREKATRRCDEQQTLNIS